MQAIIDQLAIASGSELLLRQLVVWLSALSVFVLFLGGAALAMTYVNPVRRRVDELAEKPRKRKEIGWLVKAAGAIGPIGAFVLPQDELERHKMMSKLHQAGYRTATAMQAFYLIKTTLMLVAPLVVIIGSSWMPEATSGNVLLYAVMAAGVGMLAPNIVLEKLHEKRTRAISNGFPDALDLLVVCVESGLGLASALQRVADELSVSHPNWGRSTRKSVSASSVSRRSRILRTAPAWKTFAASSDCWYRRCASARASRMRCESIPKSFGTSARKRRRNRQPKWVPSLSSHWCCACSRCSSSWQSARL